MFLWEIFSNTWCAEVMSLHLEYSSMRWLERKVSEKRVKRKIRAWMILADDRDLLVMQDCSRFNKFKLLTSIKIHNTFKTKQKKILIEIISQHCKVVLIMFSDYNNKYY